MQAVEAVLQPGANPVAEAEQFAVIRVIKGATQLRASHYRGMTTSLQFFPEKSIRISPPKQRSTSPDVTKKDGW